MLKLKYIDKEVQARNIFSTSSREDRNRLKSLNSYIYVIEKISKTATNTAAKTFSISR